MSNFFTRSGDNGYTGVLGKGRLQKNHPRLEAVGTIDEATAALGVARSQTRSNELSTLVITIQRDLYNLMAEVAATPENADQFRFIDSSRVSWMESQIDSLSQSITIPNEFIIPGDSRSGANYALARTIVRRAERQVAGLYHNGDLENQELLIYLNRLSSLCFILELIENNISGKDMPTLAKE